MLVTCLDCGNQASLTPRLWRCPCGGAWEFSEQSDFDPGLIEIRDPGIWRYRRLFRLDISPPVAKLGAGGTPLLPASNAGWEVLVKPEYFAPTSSFKDRGTAVMINILAQQGVKHVADDSSGNAGASVAAYAARAGMQADVFVPAYASSAKQAQIAVYGATVHPIPGPRVNAKLAAFAAAESGIALASHAYHPGFLLGQQTLAWELWEQLAGRAPDWYIVPVGQGLHLLGVWLGFRRLLAAGLVDRIPKMVGVQAAALDPVRRAFEAGLDHVPAVEPSEPSAAEGLAIAEPARGRRLLQALRESGGTCLAVGEEEIRQARKEMARQGFFIEPTSATAVAALPELLPQLEKDDTVVIPLTGSGLKGAPAVPSRE